MKTEEDIFPKFSPRLRVRDVLWLMTYSPEARQ